MREPVSLAEPHRSSLEGAMIVSSGVSFASRQAKLEARAGMLSPSLASFPAGRAAADQSIAAGPCLCSLVRGGLRPDHPSPITLEPFAQMLRLGAAKLELGLCDGNQLKDTCRLELSELEVGERQEPREG